MQTLDCCQRNAVRVDHGDRMLIGAETERGMEVLRHRSQMADLPAFGDVVPARDRNARDLFQDRASNDRHEVLLDVAIAVRGPCAAAGTNGDAREGIAVAVDAGDEHYAATGARIESVRGVGPPQAVLVVYRVAGIEDLLRLITPSEFAVLIRLGERSRGEARSAIGGVARTSRDEGAVARREVVLAAGDGAIRTTRGVHEASSDRAVVGAGSVLSASRDGASPAARQVGSAPRDGAVAAAGRVGVAARNGALVAAGSVLNASRDSAESAARFVELAPPMFLSWLQAGLTCPPPAVL